MSSEKKRAKVAMVWWGAVWSGLDRYLAAGVDRLE